MGVFGDYALKYYESGIYVIPTNEKKEPKIKDGFKEDAKKLNVVESWIGKYPDANIAVLMGVGKMQNIVAFDIDLDGPLWEDATAEENMTKAAFCLPYSPVFKKGKKGITIFYRCYFQYHKPNGKKIIDFITNGYTVIPPSLYYEKKDLSLNEKYNYKWGPYDLLSFDLEELPELKQEDVDRFFGIFGEDLPKGEKLKNGRDTHISEMCWAALHKNKPREVVIQELLEIDQRMHETPFATDKKESKTRGRTPEQVMADFVDRAIKKLGDQYQPGLEVKPIDVPTIYSFERKEKALPHLPEFLSELACYLGHGTKCYNGSVIFALFVMSQLFGKRIEFYNSEDELRTAINLYFLYVCPSGIGKGRLKTRMLNFLRAFQNKQENARRVQAPKSEAAIYKMFKKPVVAIIQEEFHKLLAFSKNNNSPLSGINETLGDIFGEGAGELLPKDAADDSNASELILEPFLSILGMTQPRSFKNKVLGKDDPDEIFHQGLGARLIYAVDANKKLPRIDKNKTALNISYFEKELGEILKLVRKDQLTGNVPRIDLGTGVLNLVQALAEEYDAEADAEDERSSGESLLLPVINRRLECSLKIGVIYALCEIRNRNRLIFECADLLGAIELVRYFESQLDELIFREKVSDDAKRVLDRIINAKENGITEREIIRKNHQEKEIVRQQIIALLGQKLIVAAERKEKTGPATIVYISSKFINPN